jgi:F-type H+-transporting ATPase subunit gamma
MASVRQIQQRIKAAGNISKITKAMEMVSASKMRRAQEQALATRPYTRALQESLATLGTVINPELHPLLQPHGQGKDVAIILSSDKGLSGSLNPNLFKAMLEWYREQEDPSLILVGRKVVAFAQINNLAIHAQFTDLPDRIGFADTLPITNLIAEGFLAREFRTVSLIYMDFISTLVQKPRTVQLLPLPKTLTMMGEESLAKPAQAKEYTFEPSPKEILNELLPYYLENSVYQAFLEGKASEHSARMVSMKNASENASELKGELTLEYNKFRQASITSELLDLSTALLGQQQ